MVAAPSGARTRTTGIRIDRLSIPAFALAAEHTPAQVYSFKIISLSFCVHNILSSGKSVALASTAALVEAVLPELLGLSPSKKLPPLRFDRPSLADREFAFVMKKSH